MNFESIIALLTLVAVAIGLFWGMYEYSRVLTAQLFLELTRRFDEIMQDISKTLDDDYPVNVFDNPPEPTSRLTAQVVRYINFCSEEFYLLQVGFLSRRIWRIWEKELRRTLNSSLIRREWVQTRRLYHSFPEFQKCVDDVQAGGPAKSPVG